MLPKAKPHRVRGGWYEMRDARVYVLTRRWPPRFDVVAQARFPRLRRRRLAQQVRQDLWRHFRTMRGFSPVIRIDGDKSGDGMTLSAGGALIAAPPLEMSEGIRALLTDPRRRARWIAHARIGVGAPGTGPEKAGCGP